MTEIQVLSFVLTDTPVHQVFFFPRAGKPKELKVVGCVLAKVTELIGFTPETRHTLEPVVVHEGAIVLGAECHDSCVLVISSVGNITAGLPPPDAAKFTVTGSIPDERYIGCSRDYAEIWKRRESRNRRVRGGWAKVNQKPRETTRHKMFWKRHGPYWSEAPYVK